LFRFEIERIQHWAFISVVRILGCATRNFPTEKSRAKSQTRLKEVSFAFNTYIFIITNANYELNWRSYLLNSARMDNRKFNCFLRHSSSLSEDITFLTTNSAVLPSENRRILAVSCINASHEPKRTSTFS
jgi:hypothetical protein